MIVRALRAMILLGVLAERALGLGSTAASRAACKLLSLSGDTPK